MYLIVQYSIKLFTYMMDVCTYVHCIFTYLSICVAKVDDNVDTTPEHKRSSSEKVLPEENSLGNGK